MRSENIIVLGSDRIASRAHAAARMSGGAAFGRPRGMGFANHVENHHERPGLRGLACVYGQVFERDGTLHAFVQGCFTASLTSGSEISLQIEHDPNIVFGSTRSGLKFVDTQEGLAFEFEIPKTQPGSMLTSIVASRDRTDVSVGVDIVSSEVRQFRGRDVKLITAAALREISVCREGAVSQSHARVVDLDGVLSLHDEIKHGVVAFMGRMNEMALSRRTGRRR